MAKFTSFILLHDGDGDPFLVNINDISFVKDHAIWLRSCDDGFSTMESLQDINNMLVKELSDD